MYISNQFQYFDYGPDENIDVYGKVTPKQVDVSVLRSKGVPMALFSVEEDLLSPLPHARYLAELLGPETVRLHHV